MTSRQKKKKEKGDKRKEAAGGSSEKERKEVTPYLSQHEFPGQYIWSVPDTYGFEVNLQNIQVTLRNINVYISKQLSL